MPKKLIILIMMAFVLQGLPSKVSAQDGRTNRDAAIEKIVTTTVDRCLSLEPPLEEASERCTQALATRSLSREQIADVFMHRGILAYMLGNLNDAMNDLNQSIQANPEVGKAYYHKGLVFEAMGEDKRADGQYKNARLYSPDDPEVVAKLKERNIN